MFVRARVRGRVLCERVRLLCVHACVMSTSKWEASLNAADLRFIFDEHTVAKNHRCFDCSCAIVLVSAQKSLLSCLWKPLRTPDVAARNVVAMAGSKGAAGALPRASTRTRRPSAKARAQSAECDHVKKPQGAGGARRGGRAAASEGLRPLTPAPRKRRASHGGGGDGGDDTPQTGASLAPTVAATSAAVAGDASLSTSPSTEVLVPRRRWVLADRITGEHSSACTWTRIHQKGYVPDAAGLCQRSDHFTARTDSRARSTHT